MTQTDRTRVYHENTFSEAHFARIERHADTIDMLEERILGFNVLDIAPMPDGESDTGRLYAVHAGVTVLAVDVDAHYADGFRADDRSHHDATEQGWADATEAFLDQLQCSDGIIHESTEA